jgi:hypothetical protein
MKYISIITPFITQRAKIKDALSHQTNKDDIHIISPQESQGDKSNQLTKLNLTKPTLIYEDNT